VIAAENCGMPLDCRGHYETEVYGVRAVGAALAKAMKVRLVDLTKGNMQHEEECRNPKRN